MSNFTGDLATRWLDDNKFEVLEPYRFDYGEKGSGVGIFVAEGTITDLMSLPRIIRSVVTRTTSGSIASVPHDIVYKTSQLMTYTVDPDDPANPVPIRFGPSFKVGRGTADLMFLDAMLTRGMGNVVSRGAYAGLVVGGWVAWERYRKLDARKKL